MTQTDKVKPVVLLLTLQGSFPASQMVGVAQQLEVVPFRLDSDALRQIVPNLFEMGNDDRWAFCQAFANRPAYLVAIVTEDGVTGDRLVKMFADSDGGATDTLFGDALAVRLRDEVVVSIDPMDALRCDRILHVIGDNTFMPGVLVQSLVGKLDVIRGHVRMLRYQAEMVLERKQWQSPCDQAPA